MTALCGYWSLTGRTDPGASCQRMLSPLGIYGRERPSLHVEGSVAFGRRLFATLPEDRYDTGLVEGGGGRWRLAADLRIDNREELETSLGILQAEAKRLSDSAVLMRAIERWELQAFDRIVGEFATALWDRDERRLVLARDFAGQRPLFYHRGSDFVAFASMPKGLHALPEVPKAADEGTILRGMVLRLPKQEESFFKGLKRVAAGELCILTAHGQQRRRHWSFDREPLRLRTAGEYEEAVREVFDRAVLSRLRGADNRVACQLSGGLDSSAVAATAARLIGPTGQVTGFTSVPEQVEPWARRTGAFADEGSHAAAVVALHPNMDHVLIRTGAVCPFASLDRAYFLADAPVLNLANKVWTDAIEAEASRRGHKILLTGQFGNLTISYTGLEALGELASHGKLLRLLGHTLQLKRKGTSLKAVARHTLGPFLPDRLWQQILTACGRDADLLAYAAVAPSASAALTRLADEEGLGSDLKPRRTALESRLLSLERMDLSSIHKGALAGSGLDMRDPTADRRLVELCFAMPAEQYLCGGVPRSLVRRAFSDRLPYRVTNESRRGLQGADWHLGLLASQATARDQLDTLTRVSTAASMLDTVRLSSLLDSLPNVDWTSKAVSDQYRRTLLRGISAGHFLRKSGGWN